MSDANNERKIIDEANYQPKQPSVGQSRRPYAVGEGGDPLFRHIRATKEQLTELLDETTTVQDWIQRETCNKVALTYLKNENLKEVYYEIRNGFGEYGPILLMGFKTPQGIEIPRLKICDKNGDVIEVLTGPSAIDELNKRALAYKETKNGYEPLENICEETTEEVASIKDYSGNPEDYL